MNKLNECGSHLATIDDTVYIDMGWLGMQPVRVIADIFHSRTIGYTCNISHITWKASHFRVDILYKINKEKVERIEWECIRTYRKQHDEAYHDQEYDEDSP